MTATRIYYKRALEELAPLVGAAELLDGDPWLVIDRASDEIVALRKCIKSLELELEEKDAS